MLEAIQTLFFWVTGWHWFSILLACGLIYFGAQAAWMAIDVHLDADVNKNYNDITGAHSKNIAAAVERLEEKIEHLGGKGAEQGTDTKASSEKKPKT